VVWSAWVNIGAVGPGWPRTPAPYGPLTGTRGANWRHSEDATAGRTVDAELASDFVGETAAGGCARAPGKKGGAWGFKLNLVPGRGGKAPGENAGTAGLPMKGAKEEVLPLLE
jgi:hypothetical protein